MIRGTTAVIAIIGHPVAHSLSPVLHNSAFMEAGLDFVYIAFDVRDLEGAVTGVQALGIQGLSVTMPHKSAIIPLLDRVDPAAEAIGAVNTVVLDAGKLCGYNTDTEGVVAALEESGESLEAGRCLILGAGGAARAAAFGIAERYPQEMLVIAARDSQKATLLAEELASFTGLQVEGFALHSAQFAEMLREATLVVNATSVGMGGEGCLIRGDDFKADAIYFDIVYTPIETPFIRRARDAGAVTVTGERMFLWQAVAQFTLWTGARAPVALMEKRLLTAIRIEDSWQKKEI